MVVVNILATTEAPKSKKKKGEMLFGVAYLLLVLVGCQGVQNQIFTSTLILD